MGLWTAVPDEVLTDASLSSTARLLYCILCSHAWKDKTEKVRAVDPDGCRLKEELGVGSTRTVERAMAELVKVGLIERHRRMGNSTVTTIPWPATPGQGSRDEPDVSVVTEPTPVAGEDLVLRHSPSVRTQTSQIGERRHVKTTIDPEIVTDPLADPPSKAQVTKKRHYSTGQLIARLYNELWLPAGAPRRSSDSPGVLVDAAKHFEGLKYTPYKGQSVKDVMAFGAARFVDAYQAPTWGQLWGGSKRPAGAALAEFLDGQWDKREKKEEADWTGGVEAKS